MFFMRRAIFAAGRSSLRHGACTQAKLNYKNLELLTIPQPVIHDDFCFPFASHTCPHVEPGTSERKKVAANISLKAVMPKKNPHTMATWSCSQRNRKNKTDYKLSGKPPPPKLHPDSKQKAHMDACCTINHSAAVPTYDTYTKPTCNLSVTSTPALSINQTPTQHSSPSPRSQFRARTQLVWRLFLMCFHTVDLPLSHSVHAHTHTQSSPPQISLPILRIPVLPLAPSPHVFFSSSLVRLQILFRLLGWHLRHTKLITDRWVNRRIPEQEIQNMIKWQKESQGPAFVRTHDTYFRFSPPHSLHLLSILPEGW